MKKSANSAKKSKNTELQRKAENNITIVTCSIVIYALILMMINSMLSFPATIAGAMAIRRALMYIGVAAGLVIASYSAYKSNKSLVKYALMCFFIAISSAGILLGAPWGMRATWLALIIGFVLVCVYAVLTEKRVYYSAKKVRVVFKTIVAVIYAALLAMIVYGIVTNSIAMHKALNNPLSAPAQNEPAVNSEAEPEIEEVSEFTTDATSPSEAVTELETL